MTQAFEIINQNTVKLTEVTDVTEVLIGFLLDRTGSMGRVRDTTIQGFNEYLGTLKAESTDANIANMTFVQFDTQGIDTIHATKNVLEIEPLTRETYVPRSNTNLYDAVAHIIRTVDDQIRNLTVQPKVMITIMTDGEENGSRLYTLDMVNQLIKEKQEAGWTFVYLGANQEAWRVARNMGVHVDNARTYNQTDTAVALGSMATVVNNWRAAGGGATKALFSAHDSTGFYGSDYTKVAGSANKIAQPTGGVNVTNKKLEVNLDTFSKKTTDSRSASNKKV